MLKTNFFIRIIIISYRSSHIKLFFPSFSLSISTQLSYRSSLSQIDEPSTTVTVPNPKPHPSPAPEYPQARLYKAPIPPPPKYSFPKNPSSHQSIHANLHLHTTTPEIPNSFPTYQISTNPATHSSNQVASNSAIPITSFIHLNLALCYTICVLFCSPMR